ncbi:DNA starvation/stationary phase protection protein Dps [soil metagenome]|nr:DNA starvation/stationary phase protection protein Dps [Trueperaceae bacterium]
MSKARTRSFTTAIGFADEAREALTHLADARLADTVDLYSQLKQAHWNVKGKHFQSLHELFDAIAEATRPYIDELAERVTTLGGVAHGTIRMAAGASSLDEYPADLVAGIDHLEAVRDRLAAYVRDNRDAIERADELGDPVTADLLTEVGRTLELKLYFVESHLQD